MVDIMASDAGPERGGWLRRWLSAPRLFCPGTLATVVSVAFAIVAVLFALSLPPNAETDTAADDPGGNQRGVPTHDVRMDGAPSTPAPAPKK
jgi:hypothetical protein